MLAQDPGAPPVGLTVFPEAILGNLLSGDAIGIDGRWCNVERCTSVNEWVSVKTADYCPNAEGFSDVPIFLARRIEDVEEGSADE